MPQLLILEKVTLQQLTELGDQIAASLNQRQGFRLGESTVISSCLHRTTHLHPGEIRILVDRDAGIELAHRQTPGQIIHVDIFHAPAVVKHQPLVQIMNETIQAYLSLRPEKPSGFDDLMQSYAERIYLETGTGSGNLIELLAGSTGDGSPPKPRRKNHVQLLLDRFAAADMAVVSCLVDAVETELAANAVEIRKVDKIAHVEKKSKQPAPAYLFGLEPDKYQLWDTATTLTTMLSGPEDVIEFLQAFMPGMFNRKQPLSKLRNKHGPMRDFVIGLTNAGLIRRGWFADTLTKEGQELLEFVMLHQRELESQMRKLLRQVPVPSTKYQSERNTSLKSSQKHYAYTSKTTTPLKNAWLGSIAVSETIVQAAKNRFLQKRSTPLVTREDIKVHETVMSKPVDVCLVIDGSASMAGPKMKAVWQLAEHLLLTTRDRIAVVLFQHHKARVVIPFTRNYTQLKLSLRSSMRPNGLTPLADGITEALQLIKNRHVRNPLLVLITDGVPTFGKWTIDPRKDALRAAAMVPLSRANLICIGVASNQEFLKELAHQAKGSVYIVEDLEDKSTLIEIMHQERKYQRL
ncbi:MAG: VWA domain-containing protein [Thermacetogeniaceae bacterium]